MGVVPAGVHRAVVFGGELEVVLLLNRERVHVGAERERRARLRPLDLGDDAGLGDARLYGYAVERAERFGDECGRLVLLECEFGLPVEAAAERDDLVEKVGVEGLDAVFHRRRRVGERQNTPVGRTEPGPGVCVP